MSLDLSAALPLILLGLALLVVAVWLLTRRNRKAKVVEDGSAPALARDVLDEGAEKARRNQALIDAAPAAVKVMAEPVPVPMPMPAPTPAPAAADDLTRIKGVGPKLVTLLGELGITSYAQIAAWSDADVERIDAQLGRFKGRITRDQWIEQAKLLAAGDEVAFTDKFGRNG
ncbi:MAG: hypothetical protein KJ872_07685 [Alphaproteobacteria bacterium]|nr:hypothetical protein [Alphaproteobacteria bacterium]